MKPRQIFLIRLSPTWTKVDSSAVRDLARYFYSFYAFLQLSDPFSRLAWGLGTDKEGAIYLAIFEIRVADKDENPNPLVLNPKDFETNIDVDVEVENETGNDEDDDDDDFAAGSEPDRWDRR